jgi:hypothetical protein
MGGSTQESTRAANEFQNAALPRVKPKSIYNRSFSAHRRVLTSNGICVLSGMEGAKRNQRDESPGFTLIQKSIFAWQVGLGLCK